MCGEEFVRHRRLVRIAVPGDVTEDEIDQIQSDVLEGVPEPPEWYIAESDGICGSIETVDFVGEIYDNDPVDAELIRNAEGDLVMLTK